MAQYVNIPLTQSEQEIIAAYEENYNYMSQTHDNLVKLLESKINSSPAQYSEAAERLARFLDKFKQFSKERGELLKDIHIDRRTV